jgi:hypothetical protein
MDSKQVKKQTPEEIDELMKPHRQSRFPPVQYPEHDLDAADPTLQAYADSDAAVENVASDPPTETVSPQAPNESSSIEETNSDSSTTKRST